MRKDLLSVSGMWTQKHSLFIIAPVWLLVQVNKTSRPDSDLSVKILLFKDFSDSYSLVLCFTWLWHVYMLMRIFWLTQYVFCACLDYDDFDSTWFSVQSHYSYVNEKYWVYCDSVCDSKSLFTFLFHVSLSDW